jgi:ComF family protein
MAALMAAFLHDHSLQADLAVSVPLFPRRQRQRGYNQSALLARETSRRPGLPLATKGLARRRSTLPQARSADLAARRANVAGAFVADPAQVTGRRVLLIDHVMTTGATLDACARVVLRADTVAIFGLTFARED